MQIQWRHPKPHLVPWQIEAKHIDHYQHVNNVEYVRQLEVVAWAHSNALGLSIADYQALDRGMAITQHQINYLGAALLGDTLLCATWITHCDGRLRMSRHFQFVREQDGKTLLTAQTDFTCIALSSGHPKRIPKAFLAAYLPVCVTQT